MARQRRGEPQLAIEHGKIMAGWNDVAVIGLDFHAVDGLAHGHRGVAGEQLNHHAFVGGVEVLNEDKRHAGGGRQRVEQLAAGIKAARRGADADDREGARRLGRVAR